MKDKKLTIEEKSILLLIEAIEHLDQHKYNLALNSIGKSLYLINQVYQIPDSKPIGELKI